MFLTDVANTVEEMVTIVVVFNILKWLLIIGVFGVALYFVIRAICKYQAKQNAEAFDYDYLAERTAEEVCKRMMLIERQKQSTQNDLSGSIVNQNNNNTNSVPVQEQM